MQPPATLPPVLPPLSPLSFTANLAVDLDPAAVADLPVNATGSFATGISLWVAGALLAATDTINAPDATAKSTHVLVHDGVNLTVFTAAHIPLTDALLLQELQATVRTILCVNTSRCLVRLLDVRHAALSEHQRRLSEHQGEALYHVERQWTVDGRIASSSTASMARQPDAFEPILQQTLRDEGGILAGEHTNVTLGPLRLTQLGATITIVTAAVTSEASANYSRLPDGTSTPPQQQQSVVLAALQDTSPVQALATSLAVQPSAFIVSEPLLVQLQSPWPPPPPPSSPTPNEGDGQSILTNLRSPLRELFDWLKNRLGRNGAIAAAASAGLVACCCAALLCCCCRRCCRRCRRSWCGRNDGPMFESVDSMLEPENTEDWRRRIGDRDAARHAPCPPSRKMSSTTERIAQNRIGEMMARCKGRLPGSMVAFTFTPNHAHPPPPSAPYPGRRSVRNSLVTLKMLMGGGQSAPPPPPPPPDAADPSMVHMVSAAGAAAGSGGGETVADLRVDAAQHPSDMTGVEPRLYEWANERGDRVARARFASIEQHATEGLEMTVESLARHQPTVVNTPPPPPPPPMSDTEVQWQTALTADGEEYYFNPVNGVVTWDRPKELRPRAAQC